MRRPDIPQSVSLEVCGACNRRCPWCPQSGGLRRKQAFLPEELFRKVVDELASVGFEGSVGFHIFNEPLLDPRLVGFVAYARARLPKSSLYFHSNGDLLTIETWRGLLKAGLSKALVNQYDGRVTRHVKRIVAQMTEDEKRPFGVRRFRQTLVCNRAGLVETATKVPVRRRCRRMRQMCVNYLGDIVLCCNDYLGAVSVGNVRDKGIIEMYNDPLMRRYRHELKYGRRASLKLCDKCDL